MLLLYVIWGLLLALIAYVFFNPGYKNSRQMVKIYPSREKPAAQKMADSGHQAPPAEQKRELAHSA